MLVQVAAPSEVKAILRQKYGGVVATNPSAYKDWLRAQRAKLDYRPRTGEEARALAREFWRMYEQVNRDYDPDDPCYVITREGAALSTTADHLGLHAPATGQVRILEIILSGEATASAVNRIRLIETGNGTGETSITPEPLNNLSAAAGGTYGHSSTTATTGLALLAVAINAFGGLFDWKPSPGGEIAFANGFDLGWRSASGTSTCTSTIYFEEL
jgi:hypothetical protein